MDELLFLPPVTLQLARMTSIIKCLSTFLQKPSTLLNTLNDIWITGNFPSTWHNSLGATDMLLQYQNPAKIQQIHPVTVPLLLQAVFVTAYDQ